jgi:NAD(P)-dependent dehydrogenase (short-subunit alcohol dehydrogenase family)
MSRIFITGSTDGLGLAAARTLISEGHDVVVHARSKERASVVADVSSRVVIGCGFRREAGRQSDQRPATIPI